LLAACGGKGCSYSDEQDKAKAFCEANPLQVQASPPAGVTVAMDVTLTAREGTASTEVDWSLDGSDGGLTTATLTPGHGLSTVFHAQSPGNYLVFAGDPNRSKWGGCSEAQVPLTVNADNITAVDLAPSPDPPIVPVNGVVSLTATVHSSAPSFDGSVSWEVSPLLLQAVLVPNGGTASFRSSIPGQYVVTATSVADSSKKAQLTMTVQEPVLSVSVVAPSAAEVEATVLLEARLTKSLPTATDRVGWSVSPVDAVESLTPTGDGTATLVGKRPHAVLTVTARSVDSPSVSGSAQIVLTPLSCLEELMPLAPVEAGDHLPSGGRVPVVVDPSGLPIVGSIELNGTRALGHVRRAIPGGWETLGGGPVVTAPSVEDMALALDASQRPVVAFTHFDPGLGKPRVGVQRWDGAQWIDLGIPSGTSKASSLGISLVVDALDHPLVAWKNEDAGGELTVSRWDPGNGWTKLLQLLAQQIGGVTRNPQLLLGSNGAAYLSWDETGSLDQAHHPMVGSFSSSAGPLTLLGTPDPAPDEAFDSAPSIALDDVQLPVAAWVDYPGTAPRDVSLGIQVSRWSGTGTAWTQRGTTIAAHLVDETTAIHQLVASASGARLGLTTVETNDQNAQLWEWDGQAWNRVCSAVVDPSGYATRVRGTGLQPDPTAGYWVAATAESAPDLILVERIQGQVFSLSILTATLPDVALGQPYDQPLRASGGSPPYRWGLAGQSTLPPGLLLDPSTGHLAGTPLVAGDYHFTVQVTDQLGFFVTRELALTVTSCTEALPPISVSAAGNTFQILGRVPVSVDPQGKPVVAWVELEATGFVTHVARLENGAWSELGTPLPSNSFGSPARFNVDLALAADGSPYVGYLVRNGGQDDIAISHLVSGAWVALPRVPTDSGEGGFALRIDPLGRPVVAFVNVKLARPFHEEAVARLENGSWVSIGGIVHDPNAPQGENPALAVDASGTRYLAWDEEFLAAPATAGFRPYAFKVDGAGAGDLGTPNQGADPFPGAPALAIDDAGELAMAWADYDDVQGGFSLGIRVHVFRAGGWVPLGGLAPGKAGGVPMQALAFNGTTHRFGLASVYSTRQPDDFIASVHQFDGSAWQTLCNPIPDPSNASGRAEGLTTTGLAWDPGDGSYIIAGTVLDGTRLFLARVHP
jgi:hypothetical protein